MKKIEEEKIQEKHDDEIIYLNVAGESFATLSSTIETIEGTKLYDMLTKKGELETDSKGVLFIDRPSEPFENILNALRTGRPLYLPEDETEEENLMKEVQFYGLMNCFKETQSKSIRWKITHTKSSDYTISNNTILKTSGSNSWTNCWSIGDTPLNKGVHYWEWKCLMINSDGSGTVIGVTTNTNSPYFSSDLAIGFSGSMYSGIKGIGIRPKVGDQVGILLDFKNCKKTITRVNTIRKNLLPHYSHVLQKHKL
eukprot:gene5608-9425_t